MILSTSFVGRAAHPDDG